MYAAYIFTLKWIHLTEVMSTHWFIWTSVLWENMQNQLPVNDVVYTYIHIYVCIFRSQLLYIYIYMQWRWEVFVQKIYIYIEYIRGAPQSNACPERVRERDWWWSHHCLKSGFVLERGMGGWYCGRGLLYLLFICVVFISFHPKNKK